MIGVCDGGKSWAISQDVEKLLPEGELDAICLPSKLKCSVIRRAGSVGSGHCKRLRVEAKVGASKGSGQRFMSVEGGPGLVLGHYKTFAKYIFRRRDSLRKGILIIC